MRIESSFSTVNLALSVSSNLRTFYAPFLRCTYRLILSACGCEDYDDLLRTETSTQIEDDDDDGAQIENVIENKNKNIAGNVNDNPILKIDVMLKKLHSDPGTFSALTDSVKSFLVSLPNSSERTILGCYVAER